MSLAANLNLVTKVYFPRTLLPLAAVIVPFVDFLVGLPGALRRSWRSTTRGPVGSRYSPRRCSWGSRSSRRSAAGFFLSAINVRYRDVRYMIPVVLQVLPLLSGVIYVVQEIPDEVAVGARVQPDDGSHHGLALGRDRRAAARSRARRRSAFAVGVAPLRRRPRGLPIVGAALRGHDLMSVAIEAEGLSKRYRLGEFQAAYGTLRESLVHAGRLLTRKEHRREAQEIWALRGRLVRGRRGRGARRDRPQRRRQVDAAQGADPDHRRRRRGASRSVAASAACSRSAPASTPSSPAARTST